MVDVTKIESEDGNIYEVDGKRYRISRRKSISVRRGKTTAKHYDKY